MPPIRALQKSPPGAPVFQIDRPIGRPKNQRAGIEHVRQRAGIVLRVGRNFRERLMSGGPDEFLELPIGYRRAVDKKAIHGDAVDRRFLGIMFIRSHAEVAARNPDHVGRRRLARPVDYRNVAITHKRTRIAALERATAAVTSQKYIDNLHNSLRVRTYNLIQIKNRLAKSQASAASQRCHFVRQWIYLIVEAIGGLSNI